MPSLTTFSLPVFTDALGTVVQEMAVLFLVSLVGFASIRTKLADDATVTSLTRLLVDVVVPARMATAMMAGLNAETLAQCGAIMLIILGVNLFSLFTAMGVTRIWRGNDRRREHAIWALSTMQNGIYVPLPLILAIVPAEQRDTAAVYVGGAVITMICLQWSLGVALLRDRPDDQPAQSWFATFRGALNPPLISIFVGAGLAAIPAFRQAAQGGDAPFFVSLPVEATGLLGSALAPLAMLVLGMMIGRTQLRRTMSFRTLAIPVAIRLITTPLVVFLLLQFGFLQWLPPLIALVIMVESAAPPATNLSIVARRYGGDWQTIAAALLVTYVIALITLPVFTALVLTGHGM